MDIDSNCLYLLFGETTSHLTSKLSVTAGRIDRGFNLFFNVENSIKREMRKNWFPKKKLFFCNVGNFNLFFSIFKKFIKNSNNIPSISKTIQHNPHDMVHVPAKFRENTSMRF